MGLDWNEEGIRCRGGREGYGGGNGFECGLVWNVFDEERAERRVIGSGDLIRGDRMVVYQLSPNSP